MRLLVALGILIGLCGSATAQSPSYAAGLADRTSYETWFASLTGDYKEGVLYWVGQRSLREPGPCVTATASLGSQWSQGCLVAKQRLDPMDNRRKAEPEYRAGWNSFSAVPAQKAPVVDAALQAAVNADCSIAFVAPPFRGYTWTDANRLVAECEGGRNRARTRIQDEQRAAEQARQEANRVFEQAKAQAAQLAAETSPYNRCAKPDYARILMTQMDSFATFKNRNMSFIDIEHLTTIRFGPETLEMTCHGTFVSDNGQRLTGTFATRKNIAGDPIHSWTMDR